MRAQETITIAASNKLKPSVRKEPLEAKVLKTISKKKNVKKHKSIAAITFTSTGNSVDIVRSNKMKTEYKPIVSREIFSMY